jgi:hypothetical protein
MAGVSGDMITPDEHQFKICQEMVNGEGNLLITGNPGSGKSALVSTTRRSYVDIMTEKILSDNNQTGSTNGGKGDNSPTQLSPARIMSAPMRYHEAHAEAKQIFPVTAMTNAAALIIGMDSTSLHAWLGVRIPKSVQELEEKNKWWMKKLEKNGKAKALRVAEILVIEECSMMTNSYFEVVNHVLTKVRQPLFTDQNGKVMPLALIPPFGGLRIILVGDFFQIGPVYKPDSPEWKQAKGVVMDIPLLFRTELYKKSNFVHYHLQKSYRQLKDQMFVDLLSRVRINDLSYGDQAILYKRNMPIEQFKREYALKHGLVNTLLEPTILYTTNREAKEENRHRLKNLPGEAIPFYGHVLWTAKEYPDLQRMLVFGMGAYEMVKHTIRNATISLMDSNTPLTETHLANHDISPGQSVDLYMDIEAASSLERPEDRTRLAAAALSHNIRTGMCISLKVGAQVVLTQTIDQPSGLVNNARGVVIGFKTLSGKSMDDDDSCSSDDEAMVAAAEAAEKNNAAKMVIDLENDETIFVPPSSSLETQQQQHYQTPIPKQESLREEEEPMYPIVEFHNGVKALITPTCIELDTCNIPTEFKRLKSHDRCKVYMVALPLLLAWAWTMHSAQGQTLAYGYIYCTKDMAAGQFYTALSRFPDLDSVAFWNWSPGCVVTHPDVIAFERESGFAYVPQDHEDQLL